MKRRQFLWFTTGIVGVATGALGVACRKRGERGPLSTEQQGLYDDLRQYYHYLQIDDAVISAYLKDLRQHRRRVSKSAARKQFLMSTDFFPSGADEAKPLRYVQLYDPYISVCYNPMG